MNPAPIEAKKELTKPLNKYVVSIVGDKVTFTNDIWAAIEALIDKAVSAARTEEARATLIDMRNQAVIIGRKEYVEVEEIDRSLSDFDSAPASNGAKDE